MATTPQPPDGNHPRASATLSPISPFLFEHEEPTSTSASSQPAQGIENPVAISEALRNRSDEVKAAQLGLQRPTQTNHASNQRRSWIAAKFFAASLVIMAIALGAFAAMLYSFYQRNIVPQLAIVRDTAVTRHELESAAPMDTSRAELAASQAALTKANDSILRLQRQYDALALKQQATESNFAKMVEQMQQAIAAKGGDGKPADTASTLSAALQVASVVPIATPVNQELWLLKERNRLTFYADEAIALGHSEAMDNLWRSLDDPELAKLRDGAKAEIIRVQNYYSQLSRLPPDYRLPVQDIFKDPTIRSEADLQPAQVTKLLLDPKLPIEVRARAAYVLGGHPKDNEVARALVQCLTTDPSLDVMKEAQRTLSEDHGMIIPPLHARAAAAWWKEKSGGK